MERTKVITQSSPAYPEVSVVVANFNNEQYLERCLRSLLAQETEIPFQIMLVDDASTDSSLLIAQRFEASINILQNEKNEGLPSSLNRAIRESSGRLIVRVDSDDYVSRHFVQSLYLPMALNEDLDAVACDYYDYRRTEGSTSTKILNSSDHPIACGIMFRREHLFELGLYDPEFRFNEDKELMSRFERKYTVTRLPVPLYRYRQHSNSMSKDSTLRDVYDRKLESRVINSERQSN